MDREEATRALELLRQVVTQARDDTALQNWGRIWMIHAFTNGGGFVATNLLGTGLDVDGLARLVSHGSGTLSTRGPPTGRDAGERSVACGPLGVPEGATRFQ